VAVIQLTPTFASEPCPNYGRLACARLLELRRRTGFEA
jgi:hypothetical protein